MNFPAVMKYRSNRMVLRQPQGRDHVELAAGQMGWTPVEDSTWKVGPGTQLQYAEDDMSPNCCVVVASASSKLAAEKAQEAFDVLDPWTCRCGRRPTHPGRSTYVCCRRSEPLTL